MSAVGIPPPGLRAHIAGWNSWLLAGVLVCIPIQIAPANILSGLMLALWLIEGRFAEKWCALRGNPVFWVFLGYALTFLVSMTWTDNAAEGWKNVRRTSFFVLAPVYLTVARRDHFGRYLAAFLGSVAMCELLSFYNWLQLYHFPAWPRGVKVVKPDPDEVAPFVDHLMYAPVLAWAGYLEAVEVLNARRSTARRLLFLVLLVATMANLIISGGRAGQLTFFVLLALAILQRFAKRPLLGATLAFATVALLFSAAYQQSGFFRDRVDQAVAEVQNYQHDRNSSIGLRLTMWENSFRIIRQHPWLGVGAGDFSHEYAEMSRLHTPEAMLMRNPHNQYMFVLATTGLAGGLWLLLVLLFPVMSRQAGDADIKTVRVGLSVCFVVLCLFESYLWRTNTGLLYALFSALYYARGDQAPMASDHAVSLRRDQLLVG